MRDRVIYIPRAKDLSDSGLTPKIHEQRNGQKNIFSVTLFSITQMAGTI